jgi:hypothetical protein
MAETGTKKRWAGETQRNTRGWKEKTFPRTTISACVVDGGSGACAQGGSLGTP